MQKTRRLAAIFLILLTLIPTSIAFAHNANIAGTVYECNIPKEGVTIYLVDDTDTIGATTTTDTSGNFEFLNVPWEEWYTVKAVTIVGTLESDPVYAECDKTIIVDFRYCPPCEPELSPGYWKHQVKVWILGRGRLHETELDVLAASFGYTVQDAYDELTTGARAEKGNGDT